MAPEGYTAPEPELVMAELGSRVECIIYMCVMCVFHVGVLPACVWYCNQIKLLSHPIGPRDVSTHGTPLTMAPPEPRSCRLTLTQRDLPRAGLHTQNCSKQRHGHNKTENNDIKKNVAIMVVSRSCGQELTRMLRRSRKSHRCIWAPVGRNCTLRQSGAEKLKGGSSRLRSRPAPGFE